MSGSNCFLNSVPKKGNARERSSLPLASASTSRSWATRLALFHPLLLGAIGRSYIVVGARAGLQNTFCKTDEMMAGHGMFS